jgi:hypothetical protein
VSRTPQFATYLQLKLSHLEDALIRHYAQRYAKDRSVIVRGMVRQYVNADENFDPEDFAKFVEQSLIPEHKGDKLMQGEIRRQVSDFVATHARKPKPPR